MVVDDGLIERVMKVYNLRTKREAIDLALRRLLGEAKSPHERMLELHGTGWDGDFEAIRGHPLGE